MLTQATIKNCFFATVHMQLASPGGAPLYLFHLGTDLLENLFAQVRSLTPGDNFTFHQLCQRMDIVAELNKLYIENPSWATGPRRLQATVDHVNPACVSSIPTCVR